MVGSVKAIFIKMDLSWEIIYDLALGTGVKWPILEIIFGLMWLPLNVMAFNLKTQ